MDEGVWQDDFVKVRLVFWWVMLYNLKKLQIDFNLLVDSVLEYLSKIQCNIGNYVNFFYILCQ